MGRDEQRHHLVDERTHRLIADWGATGTATTIASGPSARNAATAACIVAPVAKPSSTTIIVRLDTVTGGRSPRFALTPLELGSLMGDHRLPSIVSDSKRREHVVVPHHDASRRDRAHRQLLVTGHAELAHAYVSSGRSSASATGAATATPPRQPENDGVDVSIRLEHPGELFACVAGRGIAVSWRPTSDDRRPVHPVAREVGERLICSIELVRRGHDVQAGSRPAMASSSSPSRRVFAVTIATTAPRRGPLVAQCRDVGEMDAGDCERAAPVERRASRPARGRRPARTGSPRRAVREAGRSVAGTRRRVRARAVALRRPREHVHGGSLVHRHLGSEMRRSAEPVDAQAAARRASTSGAARDSR